MKATVIGRCCRRALAKRLCPNIQLLSSETFVYRPFSIQVEQAKKIKLPPNLIFDPKSSFAPPPKTRPENLSVYSEEKEKVKDEKEEDKEELSAVEEDEEDEGHYILVPEPQYAIPLPDRLKVEVHTLFAPEHSTLTGTFILEESVFGKDPIRVDLIKRYVNYIRAKKRGRRKAKSKTLAEGSGARRKVRRQKGLGMARAGHGRPPHWRGGYRAHGKKNTVDYGKTKLNKKVRRLAIRHMLSQKLKEGNIIVLDRLYDLPTHKTNQLAKLLNPWDIGGKNQFSALCVDHYVPTEDGQPETHNSLPVNLIVASKNLPFFDVCNTHQASVYEMLRHDKLILTLSAIKELEQRLKE